MKDQHPLLDAGTVDKPIGAPDWVKDVIVHGPGVGWPAWILLARKSKPADLQGQPDAQKELEAMNKKWEKLMEEVEDLEAKLT